VKFKGLIAATAAVALMATPTIAAAQAASPVAPAVETVEADSQMGGMMNGGGVFIPLMALAAILLGILVLLDDDDADRVSP
jgi:cytochrome c oxidase assembly factor CtaG